MNQNRCRGRGRGFPTFTRTKGNTDSYKKNGRMEKRDNKIEYKLGRGDVWVGDPEIEDDFVAWALIDNAHEGNPSFNNITSIETRIVELEQIIKFVKNDINKKAIQVSNSN